MTENQPSASGQALSLHDYESEGCKAYWAGQDRESNHYTPGTEEHKLWNVGWDQSKSEEEDDGEHSDCGECEQPSDSCLCDVPCEECDMPHDECEC